MSELDDRQRQAREAAYIAVARSDGPGQTRVAIEAAIKTATRVRITPEIERAAYVELGKAEPGRHHAALRLALRAAFEAAGFEVEE